MGKRRKTTKDTRENLYETARFLRSDTKEELGLRIPLQVYMQDPRVAEEDDEFGFDTEYLVRWEPGLRDGPTSARFAVVDYNGDTGHVAPPARWDSRAEVFRGPGDEELDSTAAELLQYHQVNVWATLQRALEFYEEGPGLGRPLSFGFEGNRLIVLPHAGYGKNAFYDRQSKTLQFYYFDQDGRRVHTCLSADVINHEFAHAVLDGIRPHLIESPRAESAAFHEFAGDLSAILLAMRNNAFRQQLARTSEGRLADASHVSEIAEEFGEAVSDRPYLRTARSKLKMSDIAGLREPHKMSQVLTSAMFDILTAIADHHVKERKTPESAFWYAAGRMQRTAVQPLDLLPPCDVTFHDYATAVLRAAELADPKDPNGYYEMMLRVFQEREIFSKQEARRLGEDRYLYAPVRLDVFHDIDDISRSRAGAYEFLDDNRKPLNIPRRQDVIVTDLYDARKFGRKARRLPRQIVLVYVWREDVLLEGGRFEEYEGRRTSMLCGGTLVFDGGGNVLSWARKPGTELTQGSGHAEENRRGELRREALLDDLAYSVERGQVGAVLGSAKGMLGAWVPPLIADERDGELRFRLSPHLNLSDDNHEGYEGGRRWETSS